jgi:hypothetical protein
MNVSNEDSVKKLGNRYMKYEDREWELGIWKETMGPFKVLSRD